MDISPARAVGNTRTDGRLDRMLTIEEMIELFPGTTRGSWAQMRFRGAGGPPYTKVGKKIFYSERSVAAWVESTLRTSTSVA